MLLHRSFIRQLFTMAVLLLLGGASVWAQTATAGSVLIVGGQGSAGTSIVNAELYKVIP